MARFPKNFRLGKRGKPIPRPGVGMVRQVKFSSGSAPTPPVNRYVATGYVAAGYVEEPTT